MKQTSLRFVSGCLIAFSSISSAHGQSTPDSTTQQVDLSGRWRMSSELSRANGTLVLKQEGNRLSGTLTVQSGCATWEEMFSGTVRADTVVLVGGNVRQLRGGQECSDVWAEDRFRGQVSKNAKGISGEVTDAANRRGRWHFSR